MNQAFRIIWNRTKQLWQCVSEETRARGKSKSEKRLSAAGKVATVLAAVIGASALPVAAQTAAEAVAAGKEAKVIYGYYPRFSWPGYDQGDFPVTLGEQGENNVLPFWISGNTQMFVPPSSGSTADILADLRGASHRSPSMITSHDPMVWMAMTPYKQTTFGSAYQEGYGYDLSPVEAFVQPQRKAVAQFQNGIRVERGVHVGDNTELILNQDVEETISGQIVLGTEGTTGGATVTLKDFAPVTSFYGDQYAYRDVEGQPTTKSALNLSSSSTWGSTRHNALFHSLNSENHTLALDTGSCQAMFKQIF